MFLLIFFVSIIVVGLITYFVQKPMHDAVRNIPGPFAIPVLGSLQLAYKLDSRSIFQTIYDFQHKYGEVLKVWILNHLFIFSGDKELNEQILASTTQITKHRLYNMLQLWVGEGLLVSDGKKWHSRRKIINPTFNFKILQHYVEIFNQQATILVHSLAKNADGKNAFNVHPYICLATLYIISETAMGIKIDTEKNTTMEYTAAVNEMTKLLWWRCMRLHLSNEYLFTIFHPFKKLRQNKLISILHKFTTNVIKERRRTLTESLKKSNDLKADDQEDFGVKKHTAMLDILLQSTIDGQPLTDEEIREEVDTFMFGGHDTSAVAISFSLYLLARHPEVQNKVLAEIHQILGDDGLKSITLTELNEMRYMECVIKESLRLYPPVPIIGREITEDFKYKHSRLGDGVIPAGTELLIVIFGMLKNKRSSKICYDFVPERHLNSDISADFYCIPFSAGPRNCIGQKYALLNMKVMLSKILLEYELLPLGKDVVLDLNLVMRSRTGMQIGLKKRNN